MGQQKGPPCWAEVGSGGPVKSTPGEAGSLRRCESEQGAGAVPKDGSFRVVTSTLAVVERSRS